MGGDTSGKTSISNADMNSTSTQDVWGAQTPYLEDLYSKGQALTNANDPNFQAGINEGAQYAGQVGSQVYDPLAASYNQAYGPSGAYNQAAAGLTDPLVQGLTDIVNSPGATFAEGGNNPLLDANVAMAMEQASQNFTRNVLPGIEQNAQLSGQFGGSRQNLAAGIAAGEANQDAQRMAMEMYGNQYAADRAANLQSQAMNDQTRLGAAQQIQNIFGGQASNVGQGAAVGDQLINLGMGSSDIYNQMAQRQYDPLSWQQGIVGGPLVLGETTATGTSGSEPIIQSQSDLLPNPFGW